MAERGSRRRSRKWQVGEKAVIDHTARLCAGEKPRIQGRLHPAVTGSGLFVEEQVRKADHRIPFGLAIF
jgi:hypothetical protein